MDREVGVPLAVALLGVAESRMTDDLAVDDLLLAERQRSQRFRQQAHIVHTHRRLARARPEERAGDADDVAEIDVLEERIAVAEVVPPEVELDASALVPEVGEGRLAVPAQRDETTGEPHDRAIL